MSSSFSVTDLERFFRYDPETGALYKKGSDSPSGGLSNARYISVATRVSDGTRKQFYVHRAAVALMTGDWPAPGAHVDHIDGDGTNNTWTNLRVVTCAQNQFNRHRAHGEIPFKGVSVWRCKTNGTVRYRAIIKPGAKAIHIGLFRTPEAAARAYDAKAIELFGEFAKTNFPAT